MRLRNALFAMGALWLAGPAGAHPVPFKDAISVMTWNQPHFNETMTTYSFHRNAAAAAQYMRMDMEHGEEMTAVVPQLNLLGRRWNERESQANIYVVGGFGSYRMDDGADRRTETTALAGVEADWESRKYYVSAKVTGLLPRFGGNMWVQTYRAGIAAYPAEFDELAAWLILDVQHIDRREREVTATPVMRLYYRNIMTEVGASFTGDWMLNFMIHL